jgi:ribosomal protein S18 acetylase RimI-like enzyme
MHPLDNVIWQALTGRQAQFAEGSGSARRFRCEVTSLSAFEFPDERGYEALGEVVGRRGTAAIFLDEAYQQRSSWEVVGGAPLTQMICENGVAAVSDEGCRGQIIELGPPDVAEMLELTALTKPGPFSKRTHELGYYIGIRQKGKLIAMAGERLKTPGHTEVSAVCTHPDHTGKGYAALLMGEVMRGIRQRGETPFLHVRSDNRRAIALYERLGFRTRKQGHYVILRKI